MRAKRVADDESLVWSGEHWIAYLRNHDDQADVGRVSLYRVAYSVAGEGHVAFVDIQGKSFTGICADSFELARFIAKTVASGTSNDNFYKHDMPIVEAEVSRDGDVRTMPPWTVSTERATVWDSIHPPLILGGPGAATNSAAVTHSLGLVHSM